MLSHKFVRLLTSVRPMHNYQQHFLRLLSTAESSSAENTSTTRETGVVKRFSKDKGYGFISKNSDGTDLFVHFKNINVTGFKTLDQGQEVEFTAVSGEKGLEARDVNIIGAGTNRTSFGGGPFNNNSTSSRFGFDGNLRKRSSSSAFNFGGNTSSSLHSDDQDSTSADKSFNFRTGLTSSTTDNLFSSRRRTPAVGGGKPETGSVKRWTEERGFGFIRRSNGGPDLFCHVRSLKDGLRTLEEGQTVQFTIQRTDKGEEARDVTVFDGDVETTSTTEQRTTTDPGERQTGTVRRWMPEKGYGFLRRDNGEPDVFVHARELSDGMTSLEEGQTVEFNVVSSGKGDTAQNVTVRDEN